MDYLTRWTRTRHATLEIENSVLAQQSRILSTPGTMLKTMRNTLFCSIHNLGSFFHVLRTLSKKCPQSTESRGQATWIHASTSAKAASWRWARGAAGGCECVAGRRTIGHQTLFSLVVLRDSRLDFRPKLEVIFTSVDGAVADSQVHLCSLFENSVDGTS